MFDHVRNSIGHVILTVLLAAVPTALHGQAKAPNAGGTGTIKVWNQGTFPGYPANAATPVLFWSFAVIVGPTWYAKTINVDFNPGAGAFVSTATKAAALAGAINFQAIGIKATADGDKITLTPTNPRWHIAGYGWGENPSINGKKAGELDAAFGNGPDSDSLSDNESGSGFPSAVFSVSLKGQTTGSFDSEILITGPGGGTFTMVTQEGESISDILENYADQINENTPFTAIVTTGIGQYPQKLVISGATIANSFGSVFKDDSLLFLNYADLAICPPYCTSGMTLGQLTSVNKTKTSYKTTNFDLFLGFEH